MPSLWSGVPPVNTARGSAARTAILSASVSVIVFALLPFPALQTKPRDQDGGEQERDHRRRDRGTFTQLAPEDRALIGQRGHQMGGIDRAASRHHPDQLEVGKREQHRKR